MRHGDILINEPQVYHPVDESMWSYLENPDYTRWEGLEQSVKAGVGKLSAYLGHELGVDESNLRQELEQRTENLKVFHTPSVPTVDEYSAMTINGKFDGLAQVTLLTTEGKNGRKVADDFVHELIHACMHQALQVITDEHQDLEKVKGGISTSVVNINEAKDSNDRYVNHGVWLNEALVETVRYKAFGSNTYRISYSTEVALLMTLDNMLPGLYETMLGAAFLGESKGTVWGRIEDKFGPLWIEEVQQQVTVINTTSDGPSYQKAIDRIVELVPEKYQEKFAQTYLVSLDEIFNSPLIQSDTFDSGELEEGTISS